MPFWEVYSENMKKIIGRYNQEYFSETEEQRPEEQGAEEHCNAEEQDGEDMFGGEDHDAVQVISSDDEAKAEAEAEAKPSQAKLDMQEAQARQIMLDLAKRNQNDRLLRMLNSLGQNETRRQRVAGREASVLLKKRALEEQAEDRKRLKANQMELRLAANEAETKKAETALANKLMLEARTTSLEQTLANRKYAALEKQAQLVAKAHSQFIQVAYPTQLLQQIMKTWNGASVQQMAKFNSEMTKYHKGDYFKRAIWLPGLWTVDRSYLSKLSQVQAPGGTAKDMFWVWCSYDFEVEIQQIPEVDKRLSTDPTEALTQLLRKCFPSGFDAFIDNYSPKRLLARNEYVMEKAFVASTSVPRQPRGSTPEHPRKGPPGPL